MTNSVLDAAIKDKIDSWRGSKDLQYIYNRPTWDKIFLDMCFLVAKRSHDVQTQCGAVLVNQDNEVISTGYNGFVRGISNDILPNLRPDKYPFMVHAEHNAILNCSRQGRSTKGAIAYVTCEPCNMCLQYMIQAGIEEVIYTNNNKANMIVTDPEYKIIQAILVQNTFIRLREVEYNA